MNAVRPEPSGDWFDCVPKVELHVHLEGAIPLDALWELVSKYGGDPGVPNPEALADKFHFKDFHHFIDTWVWKNQFLRQYEDFDFLAEAVALDLARQNIRYVEAFYSPADFRRHGLQAQKLTEAIRSGLARVPGVEVALIADMVRDFGDEQAAITLADVNEVRDLGVIGIGLGGSEREFPAAWFAPVYEQARQLGFHTTAHAGEAAGAESVWSSLRDLRAERIGHGTRANEDPSLVDYLATSGIPLEMCPWSNVCTGVVRSLREHPLREYVERGLVVTVNSDDPKMFDTSLAHEYRLLVQELGFSRDGIRALILQGIISSWLPEARKTEMIKQFRSDPAWHNPLP